MNIFYDILNSIARSKKKQFWVFLLTVILLTLGMFFMYRPICVFTDPYFHYSRLLVLMEAIQSGDFPFYLDYYAIKGYGYFTMAFYCDLFLIPYALIGNLTDITFAYDFYIFSITVLCALSMYWSMRKIFHSYFCAFTIALLYTFSAYRLFQLYYYTAMAEVISFIFIPVVFVGIYEITKGNYKKWYIFTLSFSAIIMTHVITTVLLFMLVIVFIIFHYKNFLKERIRIIYLLISGVSCLILCAYYLYPMLEQIICNTFYYKTAPFINIRFSLIPFYQTLPGLINNLPNINLVFVPKIGGLLVSLLFLRVFIYDRSKKIKIIDLGVVIGLFFILANFYFFPWTKFPFNLFSFIQFPWRLYKYTTFFFSIAGGFYLYKMLGSNNRKVMVITILCVFLLLFFRYDSDNYGSMICINDEVIDEKAIINTACIGAGEYLPSLMPSRSFPFERRSVIIEENSKEVITDYTKNKGNIEFNPNFSKYQTFELPLTYYKGYKATINGHPLNVSQSRNGLIRVSTNQNGKVKVWYEGTVIQKISPYISIVSIILLCVYIFAVNRKRKNA